MRLAVIRSLVMSLFLFGALAIKGYAQGNFVYVNTNTIPLNNVTAFSAAANGALTPISGSPFLTGGVGNSLGAFAANRSTICRTGGRLYVANDGSNSITGFDINASTGFLTVVPGSPFATGGLDGSGMSLDCTPNGQLLMAANGSSNNVSVFSVAANGALTPIPGSPFAATNQPIAIKVSPNGSFLYLAENTNLIEAFGIGATGTLTPVPGSPFSGGTFPFGNVGVAGIEINCAGTLLFAPASGSGTTNVSVFNINPNGSLAPISGSPFIFGGGNSLAAVLQPNGKFLFVSNQFAGVASLNVDASGSLSAVGGSPFAAGGGPQQLAINQSGTLLYVNNEFGGLHVFGIAGDGALTAVPGSPFTVGSGTLPSVSAFPAKSCSFDLCLQDQSNGNILQINSISGAFQFTNCHGLTIRGTGTIKTKGCTITLQANGPDRRLLARIDTCTKRGTASIQLLSSGITFSIITRDTTQNTCACPAIG